MTKADDQQQLRESIQHVADATAKKAIGDFCLLLGIDISDPIKVQGEFAAMRKLSALMQDEELLDDLAYVRRLRKVSDTIKDTTWKTIVGWVVTGALGIFLLGTKDWWLKHISG